MLSMRSTGSRVIAAAALGIVGWTGTAYACSALPQVYSLLPEVASAGETVQVEGRAVRSAAPVEIRWNGVGGPVLASVTPVGGFLSVPVRVPDVAPGIYSLTLVTRDAGVARAAFEVTGGPGSAPAAPSSVALWPTSAAGDLLTAPVSSAPAPVGVVLLSVGLVGLFAGSTVALLRRRLVPIHSK